MGIDSLRSYLSNAVHVAGSVLRAFTGFNSSTLYTDIIPILKEETEAPEPESNNAV